MPSRDLASVTLESGDKPRPYALVGIDGPTACGLRHSVTS